MECRRRLTRPPRVRRIPTPGKFPREAPTLETTGTHCLLELYDCPADLLNDEQKINEALRHAVHLGSADLIQNVSHKFTPQGITALGLLSESHISIHTWPEHGYAAADVFTCGERANAEVACLHLIEALEAGRHELLKLTRGTGGPAQLAAGYLESTRPPEPTSV